MFACHSLGATSPPASELYNVQSSPLLLLGGFLFLLQVNGPSFH